MCDRFYISHVNKCGFLVCRPTDAETIPTSISQQDKLKLNQAQPPHLHHLSHLYHPSPTCRHSLLVTNSATNKLSQSIAIIPVQHAHLHSLCISSAMDKLFQAMCNIPKQHALLIQPKCTTLVQHAQLYHAFSTTPVQHKQLQSKCTPDPHKIIQSCSSQ